MESKIQTGVKKKLAFLCYSALPFAESWGGAQRVHYMANTFSSEFDVTIFAPKYFDHKVNDNIKRLYKSEFFDDKYSRKLFGANKATATSNNKASHNYSIKRLIRSAAIRAMKLSNNLIYNEPTYFKGFVASLWIKKYGKLICNRIKEDGIPALIISIPPWNLMSVSFIKQVKQLGCKIIIDYRDPWNCWNEHKGIPFRKEKKISHLADAIFVTNENHASKIATDLSIDPEKIHVIMNGYDAELWDTVQQPVSISDKLEIAFIGSIAFKDQDSFRDPRKFMSALELFEHKDYISFKVIGCKDNNYIESVRNRIPNFEMIDSVPQIESFKWMMKSDVLVNFHTTDDNSSQYLIAGKAFDYYRSGARLLSINGIHSYERKFIEDNNVGYYSPNDITEILNVLRNIYSDWISDRANFRRSQVADSRYSRQFQNDKALRIIKKLAN